jgi:hypothetical protein
MTIFMGQGNTETVEYGAGDVGYVHQESGHYIENTGDDVYCVLIAFNSGDCQEVGLTEWLASNPIRLVGDQLRDPRGAGRALPVPGPLPSAATRRGWLKERSQTTVFVYFFAPKRIRVIRLGLLTRKHIMTEQNPSRRMSKGGSVFKGISLSKRIMLVLSLVGLLAISAVPALSDPIVIGDGDHSFVDGFTGFPNDGFFVVDPNNFDGTDGVSQEFSESRIQSGSASPSSSFSNTGDNVNACPTTQQVVNTGNVANEQGVVQYASEADDISFEGSSIIIEPSLTSDCTQTLDQATAV